MLVSIYLLNELLCKNFSGCSKSSFPFVSFFKIIFIIANSEYLANRYTRMTLLSINYYFQ